MNNNAILELAMPVPLYKLFDYRSNGETIYPGMRVRAPFARRHLVGIVISVKTHSDLAVNKLKTIDATLDTQALLTQEMLAFYRWASDYYHHPLGEVIAAALPSLLRKTNTPTQCQKNYWQLSTQGQQVNLDSLKRAAKQQNIIRYLRQQQQALSTEQLRQQGATHALLKTLVTKNLIELAEAATNENKPLESKQAALNLNTAQQQAVTTINIHFQQFKPFLLQGITGSGKTEVYLQSIQAALDKNLHALVLIPEISLTPQMINRFPATLSPEGCRRLTLTT